jgi:hypothetical protein
MDNVPRAIMQNNAIDIQSNISLGEAGDGQRGQGEREDPAQQPTNETRGGGISMVLNAAVQKMTTATIERELDWQSRVEGDAAKVTAFKEQVMNQHAFRAFAFMKGKSPAIHMAHSIGAFYGLSGMAIEVQGKQIAFVGDRINGRQPIPFILPPQNSWTWAQVRYLNNTALYGEYYRQEGNRDKLWITGATEADLVEVQLP